MTLFSVAFFSEKGHRKKTPLTMRHPNTKHLQYKAAQYPFSRL